LTFNASLKAEPINFESLPPELELFDKTISSGTLEGLVNLRGTGTDWKSWSKSGWVALTNGVVKVEGIRSPISQLALQVKLDGHTAKLKQLRWNLEESQAQVTGIIRTWDSKPKMNLALTAPQFDIDLLLPKKQGSPLRELLEKIANTAKVVGALRFDRASYLQLAFSEINRPIANRERYNSRRSHSGESRRRDHSRTPFNPSARSTACHDANVV
jgi:hypothetical protein